MATLIRSLVIVCVVGTALVWATSAQAQICGGPGAYGLGFFNYGDPMAMSYPRLPYFSLYPPVYYSYPVPRTYGYSPFAYPPGTLTPDVIPAREAAIITNPFVPKRDKPASAERVDKSASAPRTFTNPFVSQQLARD